MGAILVVNAGSTSLKLHAVEADEKSVLVDSFAEVPEGIDAVAHRVVHGGPRFRDAVVIDDEVRDQIGELVALAPLHNAPALEAIDVAQLILPHVPHVAVFDTSFHRTIPAEAAEYAVPPVWREQWGIRRYGFQGLSVEWCAQRVPELLGHPVARLVVCHLGGGSSVTAVLAGRSVDTTMGFTPLEGVPMTTRSGSIDPGALLYVLREGYHDVDSLDHALNFDSGVKGLAADDGGMIEVERRAGQGDADAALALEVMLHRLAAAVAAMAAAAGGLDALASGCLPVLASSVSISTSRRTRTPSPTATSRRTGRPSAFLSCARVKSWSERAPRESFSPQTANRLDLPNLACSIEPATSTGRSA